MKKLKIITRADLLEFYLQEDAKKKGKILPPNFVQIIGGSDPNIIDAWLQQNGFKPGAMTSFKKWAYVQLDLENLIDVAIVSSIFPAATSQNLGDLLQAGFIKSWKPDRNAVWYDNLKNGSPFTPELAMILRPALPGEKSKWYVEDGSGRSICHLQRIFVAKEKCSAIAYIGFEPDIQSTWLQKFDQGFFIKNADMYQSEPN
jgi:hypothetical protein